MFKNIISIILLSVLIVGCSSNETSADKVLNKEFLGEAGEDRVTVFNVPVFYSEEEAKEYWNYRAAKNADGLKRMTENAELVSALKVTILERMGDTGMCKIRSLDTNVEAYMSCDVFVPK